MSSEWLTTEEVSEVIGVNAGTLSTWRKRNYGPPYSRVGRCIRYRRADAEAFMERSKVDTVDRDVYRATYHEPTAPAEPRSAFGGRESVDDPPKAEAPVEAPETPVDVLEETPPGPVQKRRVLKGRDDVDPSQVRQRTVRRKPV